MRIMVTGGSGVVGRHTIAELVRAGHEVGPTAPPGARASLRCGRTSSISRRFRTRCNRLHVKEEAQDDDA
jgi:nucleoside-diphosphate-sugar epimerase